VASGKVKTYCATGDDVCKGIFVITETHLSYGSDAADAAEFIKDHDWDVRELWRGLANVMWGGWKDLVG